ncbi:MAG TPA: choice-of-anchor D domain-containing protein [Verrucomicrobiales bacterium]|nr:choice-of-anchor D domain-containing protein [Verrucomicrobiales bacterium]
MSKYGLLLSVVLTLFCSSAAAAPVPIAGTMSYMQNFSSLGTDSPVWADDATIPGWYVQINNGTTSPGSVQSTDGSLGSLNGLLNLGSPGNSDRALGSRATGTGNLANIAYAVQFRNTGGVPVKVSKITYSGELWRTNTTAGGVAETFTVFYAVSSVPVTDIQSGPNSATAAAGTGFTAFGAGGNWASTNNLPVASALNGNLAANRATVTVFPTSLTLPAGQYLVIKWTDTNVAGTDGYQGLDDVSVDFTSLAGGPEIVVEQGPATGVPDGGTVDFAGVKLSLSGSAVFQLRNAGTANLTGINLSIDGPNASDFAVTVPPPAVVLPGESHDFTVRFTPGALGARQAMLHIASNDTDENPFDLTLTGRGALPGDVDLSFNHAVNGAMRGVVLQPDGKVILRGEFNTVDSVARNTVARLNADGSVDAVFNPSPNGYTRGISLLGDGRMFIGGEFTSVGGAMRSYAARLSANGVADAFSVNLNNWVYSMAVQTDGNLVLGGSFNMANGASRESMARYSPAGLLDAGFIPEVGGSGVTGILVQPDGKILIMGSFAGVEGITKRNFARLNANGTLDLSFSGGAQDFVSVIALQPDGKILVGGSFEKVGGPTGNQVERGRLARFDISGDVDLSFHPSPDDQVLGLAVQTDGKIIVTGRFREIAGVPKTRVARLNADGSLDTGFVAEATGFSDSVVNFAVPTPGGQIYLGGVFMAVNGTARANLARVENGIATSELTIPSLFRVQWLRGGASPETHRVEFEYSSNGTSWNAVGSGVRIPGGWERTGLDMPASGLLRARAWIPQNMNYMSLVETVTSYAFLPEINVEHPAGTPLVSGSAAVNFGDLSSGETLTKNFLISNTGAGPLSGLVVTIEGPSAADFQVPAPPPATVAAGANTVFELRFAPSSPGAKSATLKIASNDTDENPFTLSLQGNRLPTAFELWRQTHFGTMEDAGDAAFNADPDLDTVDNLLEFAFGLNPNRASTNIPSWQRSGDGYILTFTQPSEATGLTYIAEYSTTLAPGAWTSIPNSTPLPQHTYHSPPEATGRLYLRLRITIP